ncbi:hypothetical protein DVH24_034815 [Malus domestica]|uniref:Sugar phosphate transporter domain-containing protein n=1 Tax=Malus domestica TaxID=3750 RepID=A0A498IGX5_MALDO|nr:hypothetical protein DVH24_034815 [Malus domestica]
MEGDENRRIENPPPVNWSCKNSCVMAQSANLSNFLVTKHTSALTLQVLGNAKGAVAVVISILLLKNPVTVTGIDGYMVAVMGVVAYGEAKRKVQISRFLVNIVLAERERIHCGVVVTKEENIGNIGNIGSPKTRKYRWKYR